MIYLDSETCGFNSIMVLYQWAQDDGPIHLHELWKVPVRDTLKLFESHADQGVVGFNLSFDWFHVCKIYTIWKLLDPRHIPEQHVAEIAYIEAQGKDGPCLKPRSAMDLMLHARTGEFQSLMPRKNISVRRIPSVLAPALRQELMKRVELDPIYFAKNKTEQPQWRIEEVTDKEGNIMPGVKNVVLKFNAASGLKYLAEHILGKETDHYDEIRVPDEHTPPDGKLGFTPTALSMSMGPEHDWAIIDKEGKVKGHAWPYNVHHHIEWWHSNEQARKYAYNDIVYTRDLHKYFGSPEGGDTNSELACMVGAVRWHGFELDLDGIEKLLQEAGRVVAKSPVNVNKPSEIRAYLTRAMDPVEAISLAETTEKAVLEAITRWTIDETECTRCDGSDPECLRCTEGKVQATLPKVVNGVGNHPAAKLARSILNVKVAVKELQLYQKLLKAGRFHPDFSVVGTLSSRMSGGDSGLNSQGINSSDKVRSQFTLKWPGMVLCGGDFDSFEVTLADVVYKDPDLHKFILSGKKIHAAFGQAMYPDKTYEEILATKGTWNDLYTNGKSGFFGLIYGGNWATLVRNFGIPDQDAQDAEARFFDMFPGIPEARKKIEDRFQALLQPTGGQVFWNEPDDYCETFLGFRRYFTLENRIIKALYELAQNPPKHWSTMNHVKVLRNPNKGLQGARDAVRSALYGAAFSLCGANVRAAGNHEIQSPGADITKDVQRHIWDLQPVGAHEFVVAPINVHDEIISVTRPDYVDRVAQVVQERVEYFRPQVPLIAMTWNKDMKNWSEKKEGSETLKIKPEMVA